MAPTNGDGKRRLDSWIDHFVQATAPIEGPELFKKWTAITTIAAILEQKVWVQTTSPVYPNLYTFLVAPPGVGKSRIIDVARDLVEFLPDPFIAPTSVNAASIIDSIAECKRSLSITTPSPSGPVTISHEYNSMAILVGEFGTFMSKYDDDLMAILTDFYNVRPYGQRRRRNAQAGHLKLTIPRPQLNILIGSTPSNLMKFMPENAWGQGFASRILFIFADQKEIVDDFASRPDITTTDLVHDLGLINNIVGEFVVTREYRDAINAWREVDENNPPKPTHPRLQHYNSRRKEHLYRLSMVSALDRSDALILDHADFIRAMGWLIEAEQWMPRIFEGSGSADSAVMDEVWHLVAKTGEMNEGKIISYIRQRVPANAVSKILEVMIQSQLLRVTGATRMGVRTFRAVDRV